MADRMLKVKKRRLRQVTEAARGHAEKAAAKGGPRRLLRPFAKLGKVFAPIKRLGRLPIWKPFRFIGKVIVPPYIRNSWRELRMVDWPTRKQTRQLTGAVILFTIVFGVLVAALDFGLDKLFKQVIVR